MSATLGPTCRKSLGQVGRREILQGAAVGGSQLLASTAHASLFPGATNSRSKPEDTPDRIAAYKRFIAQLERRENTKMVPEFPRGLPWLNVARPLKMIEDLRGNIIGPKILKYVFACWSVVVLKCSNSTIPQV